MSNLNMKRRNKDVHQKLTTEPTTQLVVVADYENPVSVIDGLVRAVVRLTIKYIEGIHYVRKRGDRSDVERAHLMTAVPGSRPIDAAKEINGELFVNALLVEAFARAGLENLMLDKHKRPYAAQLISKVHNRMFTLQTITKKRILQLKAIMRVLNEQFIMADDSYFAQMMNTTLIPNYLSRCEATKMPCYRREGLVQTLALNSTSIIMRFLVVVAQHALYPAGPGVSYKVALQQVSALISLVKQKVTKSPDVEALSVPVPRSVTPLIGCKHDPDADDDDYNPTPPAEDPVAVPQEPQGSLPMYGAPRLFDNDEDDLSISGSSSSDGVVIYKAERQKDEPAQAETIRHSAQHTVRGFEQLPPGKTLIDRVMKFLAEKECHFELDDFNRLRSWAQTCIDAEIAQDLAILRNEAEAAARRLDAFKTKYGH